MLDWYCTSTSNAKVWPSAVVILPLPMKWAFSSRLKAAARLLPCAPETLALPLLKLASACKSTESKATLAPSPNSWRHAGRKSCTTSTVALPSASVRWAHPGRQVQAIFRQRHHVLRGALHQRRRAQAPRITARFGRRLYQGSGGRLARAGKEREAGTWSLAYGLCLVFNDSNRPYFNH